MIPAVPPRVQHTMAHQSTRTLMKKMVKVAHTIPHDWISSAKSRAMSGETLRIRVSTGKAMAPPPMLVVPVERIKVDVNGENGNT